MTELFVAILGLSEVIDKHSTTVVSAFCGTLLGLVVVGGYITFFQIFHHQNHFIMTLSFYRNVKLGPTPTFYYQPLILPPHIRLF